MPQHIRSLPFCWFILMLAGCAAPPRPQPATPPAPAPVVESPRAPSKTETQTRLSAEAAALRPLAATNLGRRFLAAADMLPAATARSGYRDDNAREYYSPAEAAELPSERRAKLASIEFDEYRYYYTRYGTPLAYLRPLDLAAQAGMTDLAGRRILDFGYGSIGHLRLMASLGAHVVGVDPDSYLRALYSQATDQGAVPPAYPLHRGAPGSIALVHARWPSDAGAAARVREKAPFDLIVSKNTLKRGYLKPERKADKRQLIDVGVSDDRFLKTLHDALAPGGLLLIYNLAPKQAPPDKPYLPHADARSPFTREQYAKAGLTVLAIDAEDHEVIRGMGAAVGWDKNDKGEIVNDLNTNLFALYTIVKRPAQ